MGSNRKKKGGNSRPVIEEASASSASASSTINQHHRRNSSSCTRTVLVPTLLQSVESGGSNSSIHVGDSKYLNSSAWSTEFAEALQEVEGTGTNTLRFSWKEIFVLGLVILAFAGLSISVGVAAGISLSIHYYETQESVDLRLFNHPMGGMPQRVTILDPSIASSNSLYPLDEVDDAHRRVIYSSPSGQKSALFVVEERPIQVESDGEGFDEWNDQMGRNPTDSANFLQRPRLPRLSLEGWVRDPPKLCSDARTVGYDSWRSLKASIRDVNRYSAVRYELWQEYFSALSKMQLSPDNPTMMNPSTFDDDSMYYEEEIVFTICPGAVLKAGRQVPLFINTESVVIECEGCTITAGRSHLSFGPEAKNAIIRGVTFASAAASSLIFHHNGASASFEDCTWVIKDGKFSSLGAIAEVNSTSMVNFYRCSVNRPRGKLAEWKSSLSLRQP
jgi:hypothetical protein